MKIRRALGLDGAVAFTSLARAVSIAGSTVTVLLIVRFLSPIEQGYYYTLLSLVALQMVFELGFSLVVQQLAAHESIHLELHEDGSVSGDRRAHARLASTLQLSVRWYTVAAVAMGLILAPLGEFFFARHGAAATAHVAWHGPWLLAVAASMAGLWCQPFYSVLDGCGQMRAVAALRLRQVVAGMALSWTALFLGHGLYSPALVVLGQIAVGLFFLGARRRLLIGLLGHRVGDASIQWAREVWPFQWRIAVSWTCSYFTLQVFIPIIFALRGPVEAGQMGMSLSIAGYIAGLVLPWITTKATPFGRLIAARQFQALDRLFLRALGQALTAFVMVALVADCGAVLLSFVAPKLAARMVSPQLFAVLVLAAGANFVVQSLGILLRAFKREPFLVQSMVVATLTLLLAALTAPRWGNTGVTLGYLAVSAGIGLPSALSIFLRARREYLAVSPLAMSGGKAA
jgi:NADH:ubiquinone oxidoreductase subunit K